MLLHVVLKVNTRLLVPLKNNKGGAIVGTPFLEIYNRFLGKITDDMYMELTPEDTIRDLRNLLIGFFATNDFEIYPNAFVEEKEAMENIVDILNHVDYMSAARGNKGYSEFINSWNFIHGGNSVFGLDKNEMYKGVLSENYIVCELYPKLKELYNKYYSINLCIKKRS